METLGSFTSLISTSVLQCVRWLSLACAILVLLLGLFGLISPAMGAQKHGCAPDTPPTVPEAIPAQALPDEVLINEVLTQPKSSWNCSDPSSTFSAASDSWVELYNPQTQPLDLYAAHAQISLNGGSTNILLPFGSMIAAQGFLVLFPLEHQAVAAPTSWNVLLTIDGIVIDQAAIPPLQADQSYARVPDGATTWLYAGTPTIDASNNSTGQPILPTPTKTPKVSVTPTLSLGTSNASGPADTSAQPASSGTQPAWGQVQFPPDPTPTPIATFTDTSTQLLSQSQQAPAPTDTGPSGWIIAGTISFVLLLLGALFWCWRLFRAP